MGDDVDSVHHELRAALTLILGETELVLASSTADEEQRLRSARTVIASVRRIEGLLSELVETGPGAAP